MSQLLAKQLLDSLRKALDSDGVKSLAIGESIYKIQQTKAYMDLGFKTFSAFLITECNMKIATATRYAYKYKVSLFFPEHRDAIGKAHIVACEHVCRLMATEGGEEVVKGFIHKIDSMSVGEVKKIYAKHKYAKEEDLHFKRISATFIEPEYNEFLELEELIMRGMDLTNRREVILNSMRDMAIQARAALIHATAPEV